MSESVDLYGAPAGAPTAALLPLPGTLLPHAPPWLLGDRLVSVGDGEVMADKLVTANDRLTQDGLPETLLIEALAQTAACLNALKERAAGSTARHQGLLVQAGKFVFEGRATVGDRITLRCCQQATFGALTRFVGEASVDGRLLARGELTFAVGQPPLP